MLTTARRAVGTAIAAAVLASVATVSLGTPAGAATTFANDRGEATVLLTADDVQGLQGGEYTREQVCGPIEYTIASTRTQAGISASFSYYDCTAITAACIAQVSHNVQVQIWPDNSYSCSSYSTDGSLFARLGGLLIP